MSKLIKLTEAEIELVMQADDRFGSYECNSQAQRWYTIARNRGERHNNDIMVILCGVRNTANHAECRPIGVTSVDAKRYYLTSECDIYVSNGYFSVKRVRLYFDHDSKSVKPEFQDKTIWWDYNTSEHKFDFAWKRPLNIGEVIAANPRFKYCALPRWGTNALAWLRTYAQCPAIENFSKMNVAYLAMPNFVDELKRDREYFRYFRNNLDEIRRLGLRPTKIRYGYKHGISPQEVRDKYVFDGRVRQTRNEVRGSRWDVITCEFPRKFDWRELTRYLYKTRVSAWEYRRYAKYCVDGGADLTDPNTAFPHNLELRLKQFDENKAKMERKECDEKLAALATAYEELLKGVETDEYIVVVPSKAEHFIREGKRMDNCIGGGNYALNMAAEKCVCVFIRKADKPDSPFVDCEIADGKVRQCYTRHNGDADRKVRAFANRVAKTLHRKSKARKAA